MAFFLVVIMLVAAVASVPRASALAEGAVGRRALLRCGAGAAVCGGVEGSVEASGSSSPSIKAASAALFASIPAMESGAPATNVTVGPAVSAAIEARAADVERLGGMRGTSRMWLLDGDWRLLYSNAPEITNLARLPLGFRLGPVFQPFALDRGQFENQGAIVHATGLVAASTRVVGDFSVATPGSVNAAGVRNDRDDRIDVDFRRVIFQVDAVAGRPLDEKFISTVVQPRAPNGDEKSPRPGVDTTYVDADLRITRGGDGSLFVLRREPTPTPMLDPRQREDLYEAVPAADVVQGAGLTNWSKTTTGVFAGRDADESRYGSSTRR